MANTNINIKLNRKNLNRKHYTRSCSSHAQKSAPLSREAMESISKKQIGVIKYVAHEYLGQTIFDDDYDIAGDVFHNGKVVSMIYSSVLNFPKSPEGAIGGAVTYRNKIYLTTWVPFVSPKTGNGGFIACEEVNHMPTVSEQIAIRKKVYDAYIPTFMMGRMDFFTEIVKYNFEIEGQDIEDLLKQAGLL